MALLFAAIWGPAAYANVATQDPALANICYRAIDRASTQMNVPADVKLAITLTETGRKMKGDYRPWPWTVNMEGKGFWFDTRAEALAYVKRRHAEGARSFDVGCFQINYKWHGYRTRTPCPPHRAPPARGSVRTPHGFRQYPADRRGSFPE